MLQVAVSTKNVLRRIFSKCQVEEKYFSPLLSEKFRKFSELFEHFAKIIFLLSYFSESHFSRILELPRLNNFSKPQSSFDNWFTRE